jgi:hypothetical protein
VETIRSHRYFGRQKKLQYLLKWKGYPENDNTWEPATQVHASQLVKQYHARRPATTIRTLLLQRKMNHLPSSWIPSLTPLPQPQVITLYSPSSHLLGDPRLPILRLERSSRACSDTPRLPLTASRSSSHINALTPLTHTPSQPPLRAKSVTVDSTTDISRTPWLWTYRKPCEYCHPLFHSATPPPHSSAGLNLSTPHTQTSPSSYQSSTCPSPPLSPQMTPHPVRHPQLVTIRNHTL